MPNWGERFHVALARGHAISGNGTVYYYDEHGNRATYDITALNEGTVIVNGSLIRTVAYLPVAERVLQEHGIDIQSGWSSRP